VDLTEMGRALQVRRCDLGLSRAAVAQATGTRPVVVGRWERGELAPTLEEAERLAAVLRLDPSVTEAWAAPSSPPVTHEAPPSPPRRFLGFFPRRPTASADAASAAGRRSSVLRGLVPWTGRTVLVAPPPVHPPSYLDEPAERRRYAVRWAVTLLILGALAILLVWAVGQLLGTWGSFLDMFRAPRHTGPYSNALASMVAAGLPGGAR
jgi:transcriptional regulator with XRE-family HTH domain